MTQRLRARVLSPLAPDATRYLPDGYVEIGDDGRLVAVTAYDAQPVDEDLRPAVLVPGFVDAHVHFPQTRIIGAASGPLLQWLARSTFPEEQRFADADHAERIASVFCTCLAAAGTTSAMIYGSVHEAATQALFAELDRRGQRAIAGPVLMDAHSPEPLMVPPEAALDSLQRLVERWHGRDGRLAVAVAPRFALSCTPRMLREAGDFARRHDLHVTTHLSENRDECLAVTGRFGTEDYLEVYEDAGLVHHRSVFAHCIHLSDAEWDRLAAARVVVAHCPDSNFFLGSGNMKLERALRREIRVAVGSDVAAGRSFRIPRILSSAYDNALARELPMRPARLLWWGTRGGALALDLPSVGALEVGLDADMVCIDLPHWAESEDEVLGWVFFDHDAPRPLRTWVRGRVVWNRDEATGGFPWAVS